MSSVPYKFTTAATTNLQQVRSGQTANLKGYSAVNSAVYPIFIKLYWFPNTAIASAPTVGTTVPNMTICVNANATLVQGQTEGWPDGVTGNGDLWVAVTKVAADSDTTVVASGDGIITLLVE
jgi:hypothetical protein